MPQDISVVGIDDEMSVFFDLTTVAQPAKELGRRGAQILVDLLDGHEPTPAEVVLPTRLVLRHSVAVPCRPGGR